MFQCVTQDPAYCRKGETCLRGVAFNDKLWPQGKTLTIRHIGGTPQQHDNFKRLIDVWFFQNTNTRQINLNYVVLPFGSADIRVSWVLGNSYSQVGTDALNISNQNLETMNIGDNTGQSILHEFGHALGLGHEHSNPAGNILFNVDVVVKAIPQWDLAAIQRNIFDRYNERLVTNTVLDPLSVMMYPIPASWTNGTFESARNLVTSTTDLAFVRELYPMPVVTTTPITPTVVNMPTVVINEGVTTSNTSNGTNWVVPVAFATLLGLVIINNNQQGQNKKR